jgi:hypothetical protein
MQLQSEQGTGVVNMNVAITVNKERPEVSRGICHAVKCIAAERPIIVIIYSMMNVLVFDSQILQQFVSIVHITGWIY